MPYNPLADNAELTAAHLLAEVYNQVISQVTSVSRPGSPAEGQMIYETDTNLYQAYTGSGWVPFGGTSTYSTYTPTVTQSSLVAANVIRGRYFKIGRMVTFDVILDLTAAGTANNAVIISLPTNAGSANANTVLGVGHMRDASAALKYFGQVVLTSAAPGAVGLLETTQGTDRLLGVTGASFAAALASTDFVSIQGTYESAA